MEHEIPRLSTGTTTVGIVTKDAVILAADQRSSLGYTVATDEALKILEITPRIAITTAGGSGDLLAIARFMKSHARLYEVERDTAMSGKAAMTLLSNILNANRYYPYYVQILLGAFNGKGVLYSTDPVGGFDEYKYSATGAGMDLAISIMEAEFREHLSTEEALKLAVKAIDASKKRNIATGGKSMNVAIIDAKGFRLLTDEEIARYLPVSAEMKRK